MNMKYFTKWNGFQAFQWISIWKWIFDLISWNNFELSDSIVRKYLAQSESDSVYYSIYIIQSPKIRMYLNLLEGVTSFRWKSLKKCLESILNGLIKCTYVCIHTRVTGFPRKFEIPQFQNFFPSFRS